MKNLIEPPDAPMLLGGPDSGESEIPTQSYVLLPTYQYDALCQIAERAEEKLAQLKMFAAQVVTSSSGDSVESEFLTRRLAAHIECLAWLLAKEE